MSYYSLIQTYSYFLLSSFFRARGQVNTQRWNTEPTYSYQNKKQKSSKWSYSSLTSHQHVGHTEKERWFKVSTDEPEKLEIEFATPKLTWV